MRFDRDETSVIDKEIRDSVQDAKIGKVTQVYEHAAPDDDSNYEVSVVTNGGTEREQYVPLLSPGSDTISVPKAGDKILLIYGDEETQRPYATTVAWSNKDRPPLGRAGMWRKQVESDTSPAGDGDLHITSYTSYNKPASSTEKYDLNPEQALVQIAKHASDKNITPTDLDDVPAKVEFFDDPKNSNSWISVEINKDSQSDSDATWGMKFNIATGEFKLVDPEGFGIKAAGDGKFTWHHKDIEFNEVSGDTGPLNL